MQKDALAQNYHPQQYKASISAKDSDGDERRSPLAVLVKEHLQARKLRQVDFCRQTGFDQGLLSKILSSVVNTLNVETALKLSEGLDIPPSVVFEVIGKKDVDEMIRRFYGNSKAPETSAAKLLSRGADVGRAHR